MKGKCLCGKIEFEFEPTDGVAMNCYCTVCQRSHGAAHATQVMSSKKTLRFISGKEYLTEYQSSKYGIRAFCSCCGSRLMNYASESGNYMSVCLAAVSDEHEIQASANIHIASKAKWTEPVADIPCFDGFPSDIKKYL